MSDNIRPFPNTPANIANIANKFPLPGGKPSGGFVSTPANIANKLPGRRRWTDRAVERPSWAPAPSGHRCVAAGCQQRRAPGDLVYCAGHRVQADDGSLFVRCVMDGGHAPVALNDPTLCAAHRAESDAMVMPWEVTA